MIEAVLIGLAAGVIAGIALPLGTVAAQAIAPCAAWILGVAEYFGRPTWATMTLPPVTGWVGGAIVCFAAYRSLTSEDAPVDRVA